MKTIKARVSQKLLSKATRLFTGTLAGRIIEILQNARRAGATQVHITNHEGSVTVCDNGHGIEDFAKLLDLGNSDWDQNMDEAEDPAGVGVFCLAPREVEISSGHKSVVITEKAWTGEPVPVQAIDSFICGMKLQFVDEPWTLDEVEKYAVFSGMQVTVDDKPCSREAFVSEQATLYPELGCRIEIRSRGNLSQWHHRWKRNYYSDDVLINFYGQVVQFAYRPVSEELQCLVDLTGEPTAIRMMLPARTQIVENEALLELKSIVEKEVYRFIQKRGSHQLKYSEYCRAQELGIELPEATPAFQVGLLYGEVVEPIEVIKPDDFPLDKCYLMNPAYRDADDINETNSHLLAALGKTGDPFIPIEISSDYEGYSWSKLPTINQVEVKVGKGLASQHLWRGLITAVDSLEITARTSDGKIFSQDVEMAVIKPTSEEDAKYYDVEVLVTVKARDSLDPTDIWYHLGDYNEDSDTYHTQLGYFTEQLELFWAKIIGPGEYLRSRLLNCLEAFNLDWQTIAIDADNILSEFTSRIARGVSNACMDLWICLDEAQRLCSSSNHTSAMADLIGLIRGTGIGLDLNLQSAHDVLPAIISNTATKVLGRCGSMADYASAGHSMGLTSEQIHYAQMNLRPGLFVGQLGEGSWRYPFLFQVPPVKFPRATSQPVLDEPGIDFPVVYASEFEKWGQIIDVQSPVGAAATSFLFASPREFQFCKAVVDFPMQPSSSYPKQAGISSKDAKQIREGLIAKHYIQEHRLDTGSRGRSSLLLEPLPEGIKAMKTYGGDQS